MSITPPVPPRSWVPAPATPTWTVGPPAAPAPDEAAVTATVSSGTNNAVDPRSLAAAVGLTFGADGRPVLPAGWEWSRVRGVAVDLVHRLSVDCTDGEVWAVDVTDAWTEEVAGLQFAYEPAGVPHAVVFACIVDAAVGGAQ